ncbi:DNA adenine methylase [Candidatus Bathyarchaeota archaeon]|nr:DNA adenine methylase [Candidatus Bathyarchaeota archaeon]
MLRCNRAIEPVIKWPGSKRKIAPILSRLFPKAECYYEPFIGGGAVLPFRPIRMAVAGDVIIELIALWRTIRDTPELTANEYEIRWNRLQAEGLAAYYTIRDSFNITRNPHDLLFLSRTCVNGLIRFNKKAEFNNSLHHTRPGIAPSRLSEVIQQWSRAIQGVEFICADYRQTLAPVSANDLVFLDPPYGGTKGRYQPGQFNFRDFYEELERLNSIGAKWVLTLDGSAGSRSYITGVPSDLYKVRLAIPTGNSPFTKLMRTSLDLVVESVYLNFNPPTKPLSQVSDFGYQALRGRAYLDVQQGRLFN